jgi:hypothetical protein
MAQFRAPVKDWPEFVRSAYGEDAILMPPDMPAVRGREAIRRQTPAKGRPLRPGYCARFSKRPARPSANRPSSRAIRPFTTKWEFLRPWQPFLRRGGARTLTCAPLISSDSRLPGHTAPFPACARYSGGETRRREAGPSWSHRLSN